MTLNCPAAPPLNDTPVVPVKFVPVSVTNVPTTPLVGLNELTTGGLPEVTVKDCTDLVLANVVVTVIGPVVAPLGTTAVNCQSVTTVKELAAVPLNVTDVVPVNPLPEIVTFIPANPVVGLNELTDRALFVATVKFMEELLVPAAFVTVIGPVVAPLGTVATIWLSEVIGKKLAATPLKATPLAHKKCAPMRDTVDPRGPVVGLNELTTGAGNGVTVKLDVDVVLPALFVMVIGPLCAVHGTTAVTCVSETMSHAAAAVPLNDTAVAPVKLVPVIVTVVPAGPLLGEKELIVGGTSTPKIPADVPLPAAFVTIIGPLVAPFGTTAVNCVSETTLNAAAVPLKVTLVVSVKLVPVTVTVVPAVPLVGEKELIVGAPPLDVTVKFVVDVAAPDGPCTVIGPVCAPLHTAAINCVSETPRKEKDLQPLNVR